jgi:hypothetical protein
MIWARLVQSKYGALWHSNGDVDHRNDEDGHMW